MPNPLINQAGLPEFTAVQVAHIQPAIEQLLQESRDTVDRLLAATQDYSWDNLLAGIENAEDKLSQAWSIVSHLHSVADNKELREVYSACLTKLSDYSTEMGQHEKLFQAYCSIAASDGFPALTQAQQKIINNALRDFRLSGIELNQADKKRYKEIQQHLSKLQTQFEENLLDATQDWKKLIKDKSNLAGLPESALDLAAQLAKNAGEAGWLLTLEFPSYMPVMRYADDAQLRKEMYTAYVTRASDQAANATQWDNSPIMYDILKYRREKALLLGFESYAHYSLATKMAETPQEVLQFLNDLAEKTKSHAEKEMEALRRFAEEEDGITQLEASDIPYYSERLRKQKFAISQEDLRPYFPIDQVTAGLFAITEKLYGVTIKQRTGVDVWHKDVMFFDVFDAHGKLQAGFYLDLYARSGKRGGAWMDECIIRRKTSTGIQTPIAYLTCNFTPPVEGKPALLDHDEVNTLFHEFGHGLHHMLTQIDYSGVSGINGVPWDAVELPSQLMENWCWEKEALALFAHHVDTGDPIDAPLYTKMMRAKTFQAALQMVRQLEFALFDFRLHLEFDGSEDFNIQALLDDVRTQVAIVKPPQFNRFQHSFSHIFAGGYAAGYYSYKWAEVLSTDVFSKFQENGIFDPKTAKAFLHTLLQQGGSREPMDLFIEFRGRKPKITPLLQQAGLMPADECTAASPKYSILLCFHLLR